MAENNVVRYGEGDFDPFVEQREVFRLAGDVFQRFPGAINVRLQMKDNKIDRASLSTEIACKQGRKREKLSLGLSMDDLQTNPEFRLTLSQSQHDRVYHVRVHAKPDEVDSAVMDTVQAIGIPIKGRMFIDNWGETTMRVSWATRMLSSVTGAARPFHLFGEATLEQTSILLKQLSAKT